MFYQISLFLMEKSLSVLTPVSSTGFQLVFEFIEQSIDTNEMYPYLSCPMSNQVRLAPSYHRYQKFKIDCLRFVMCPLLAPGLSSLLFLFLWWPLTILMKQTRQAVRASKQSILFRCLCIICT